MVVRESREDQKDAQVVRAIEEKRIDDLPAGDVLIRVEYSSLNYKDALSATGHRGVTRKYPHTPGVDAAGVVEHSRVESFKEGDQVLVTGYDLGMNTAGGFGRYIRVPESWIVKLPSPLTLRESMIYGTAGFTAGMSIYKLMASGVTPERGEILVTGSTGGVGCMAVAMLAKAGFDVAAATGKTHEREFLEHLGAKKVLAREEIEDRPERPLLKGRWAGAVDTVGGQYLAAAIKSTIPNGAVACCGLVASPNFEISVFPFILRGVNLLGVDSAEFPMDLRLDVWEHIAAQWKLSSPTLERLTTETTLENLDEKIGMILKGQITGHVLVRLRG
jgi:putative YhdH/YhfP family quinone oxidoreductase